MLTPPPTPKAAIVAPEPLPLQFQRLTDGLFFISESEAPLTVVQLAPTDDLAAALRADAHVPTDTPLREQPLEAIFAERVAPGEGAGKTDLRQAPTYAALLALLRTLHDAHAVRVGTDAPQTLYLIGRTPDGRWLGVRTTTVDT